VSEGRQRIRAFFVLPTELRARMLGTRPYLLILVFLLMYVFMHCGLGSHDHTGLSKENRK
jgi:hypothetical protein